MKRLSWKYIAGLVDGEGCIDMQVCKDNRRGSYTYVRPRLRIGMANSAIDVLVMFHTNFGGSLHGRVSGNPNWQDSTTWTLEGKRLRPILQNIVNHLIIKKEQARLCIFVIDEVIGKHVPDEVRERLKQELKAMKRDPQRLSERTVQEVLALMR